MVLERCGNAGSIGNSTDERIERTEVCDGSGLQRHRGWRRTHEALRAAGREA